MDAFYWGSHFETGLEEVDQQHRELVHKINRYGERISANRVDDGDLESLIADLKDYASFHFREEEALMASANIDFRHVEQHLKAHRAFLSELERMTASMTKDGPAVAKDLLHFLSHWLAYHILDEDQCLSRQISYLEQGYGSDQAYEKALQHTSEATEPLLAALNALFDQVSKRNRELELLNERLEERVAERTKELQIAMKNLEELALTDVLTSLPNRRHALRMLSILWEETIAANGEISCMMIDADHFKEVNDNYGHDCGDLVLKELAVTLNNAVRTDDLVARLGGDEFFIICPNTGLEGAQIVANQVLEAVHQLSDSRGRRSMERQCQYRSGGESAADGILRRFYKAG